MFRWKKRGNWAKNKWKDTTKRRLGRQLKSSLGSLTYLVLSGKKLLSTAPLECTWSALTVPEAATSHQPPAPREHYPHFVWMVRNPRLTLDLFQISSNCTEQRCQRWGWGLAEISGQCHQNSLGGHLFSSTHDPITFLWWAHQGPTNALEDNQVLTLPHQGRAGHGIRLFRWGCHIACGIRVLRSWQEHGEGHMGCLRAPTWCSGPFTVEVKGRWKRWYLTRNQ